MTTKISLLSGLITALLLGTALTVAAIDFSVPAIPDSLTNIQKDLDKASAAAKANPAPAQEVHVRAKSDASSATPTTQPAEFDHVNIGDYQQAPSQKGSASEPANTGSANPHPKKKPSDANAFKKHRDKAHKQMDQAQSQGPNPTSTSKPEWMYLNLKPQVPSSASGSTPDHADQKASGDQHQQHKKKHHHHHDDGNQGND
jgi:hypothetical protein